MIIFFVLLIFLILLLLYSTSNPESIAVEIEKKCASIFPLQNVFIRKVKVLKKPKFDVTKLMELHADSSTSEETGAKVAAAKAADAAKAGDASLTAGGRLS